MSIAHAFPQSMAQKSATRQLVPGAVVKMLQTMHGGKLKEKWFVIIEVNTSTVTCIINTDIPNLYKSNPALLACQIPLAPSTQSFIHHDSHLDCSKVMSFPTSNAVQQLTDKPEWFMGTADAKLLGDMVIALNKTPVLNKAEKARYTSSLSNVISSGASIRPNGSSTTSASQNPVNSAVLPPSGSMQNTSSAKTV